MPRSRNRDPRDGGNSGGNPCDGILSFMGVVGALSGAAAIAAKVACDNWPRSNGDFMPSAVERQILAGSDSQATKEKRGLTREDLEFLERKYAEELAVSNELRNYDRASWLVETQRMVRRIKEMLNSIESAKLAGDYPTMAALGRKVEKEQQGLSRRLQQDQTTEDESMQRGESFEEVKPSSQSTLFDTDGEEEAQAEELSKDEVCALLKNVESRMSSINTGTPSGVSEFRTLHAERKNYQDMLKVFEDMEQAKSSGDQSRISDLNKSMIDLQEKVLGKERPSQERGMLDGIKECFGFKPRSDDCLIHASTKEGSPSAKRLETVKSRKRKTESASASEATRPKRLRGDGGDEVTHRRKAPGVSSRSEEERVGKKRPKLRLVPEEPTFPDMTDLTHGTVVRDKEDRLFYVARGDETLAQVADKLNSTDIAGAGDCPDVPTPMDLKTLVTINTVRYTKRSLMASAPLNEGTLLLLPPYKWPMRPRNMDDDDDECDVCGSADDAENMLLCDTCDAARHTQCCDPPLARVPEGNWYCSHGCEPSTKIPLNSEA